MEYKFNAEITTPSLGNKSKLARTETIFFINIFTFGIVLCIFNISLEI